MFSIYVTWQPESAEPGHYFLSVLNTNLIMGVDEIMERVKEIEEIPADEPYDLCSILKVKDAEVIY